MKNIHLENFIAADIYGLTAAEYSLGRSNVEIVDLLIAAGIRVIQYREKYRKPGFMLEECLAIRAKTRAASATFIVNDHVDLAILVEADGVHLGQEDLPPDAVRKLVGDQMLIGLSTHSPGQAQTAAHLGAVDYIGVGPIFATQTKHDVCEPVGLAYLDYVVENIDLPFVAIGGIKQHNIKQVKDHGARTIALVTEIVGAKDVIVQVAAIREQLK
jgi:thiamine-phosphate pyrophosphorylase